VLPPKWAESVEIFHTCLERPAGCETSCKWLRVGHNGRGSGAEMSTIESKVDALWMWQNGYSTSHTRWEAAINFHVGLPLMIIGPDPKVMQRSGQDGSNGEPYVNHLPGHPELFLLAPS
jgi:hypothetical protein